VNRAIAVLAVIAAVLAGQALATPPTHTVTVAFEGQAVDLDTGTVYDRNFLSAVRVFDDHPEADVLIGFHADRAVQAVVVQNSDAGAQISFLEDTPFESVEDVSGLTFSADLVDQAFGTEATVVVKTDLGNHYKIGRPVLDLAAGSVTLDYEQIGTSTAENSARGGEEGTAMASLRPHSVGPSDLDPEAYRAVTSYIERDLYGVRRTADAAGAGSALEGANPAQAYTTRFAPQGIVVRPGGGDAELGFTLTGWGYGSALLPVASASPRADGQRVEYVRGELTEWYVNRRSGLEQGFTLNAPPQAERGEERLRLEMTLSGPLVAEVGGDSILFRDSRPGTPRVGRSRPR